MLLIDTWDRVGTGMYFEVYITPGTERIIHYQVPGTWYLVYNTGTIRYIQEYEEKDMIS